MKKVLIGFITIALLFTMSGGYALADSDNPLRSASEGTRGLLGTDTFLISLEGTSGAFCYDQDIEGINGQYQRVDDSSQVNGNVRAILYNSIPNISPEQLKEDVNEWTDDTLGDIRSKIFLKKKVITATQYAIWHYTNGFEPEWYRGHDGHRDGQSFTEDMELPDEGYDEAEGRDGMRHWLITDEYRIYQYLINLPAFNSFFVPATASISYNHSVSSDGNLEIFVNYSASGVNGDGTPISLTPSIDNLDYTLTDNGDGTATVVVLKELLTGNINFNFMVSGTQTHSEEEPLIFESVNGNLQPLVAFDTKVSPISASTEVIINLYTLTTGTTGSGDITRNPESEDGKYISDTSVDLTATPSSGFSFVNWMIHGDPVSDTSPVLTIIMDADKEVIANFIQNEEPPGDECTITYVAGTGGSITGETSQTLGVEDEGTQVTAVADSGYHFVGWNDENLNATRSDWYVAGGKTYTASFERNEEPPGDECTITYVAGTGGSITGETSQTLGVEDEGTQVTAVADIGYHFVGWNDENLNATRTDVYTEGGATYTALFQENGDEPHCTISYEAGTGGKINGETSQIVYIGKTTSKVTAVADIGYHFTGWDDGEASATRTDAYSDEFEEGKTYTALFARNQTYVSVTPSCIIKYEAGEGGSIVGKDKQTVYRGSKGKEVTAEAEDGYHFVGWDDENADLARIDSYVRGGATYTALFEKNDVISCIIDYKAGKGGSVTGENPQTIEKGEIGTKVTAEAEEGYHFKMWDDKNTNPVRTDSYVEGGKTYIALFEKDEVPVEEAEEPPVIQPTLPKTGGSNVEIFYGLSTFMAVTAGAFAVMRKTRKYRVRKQG